MLVDGGHGFDAALSDIRHLARVASRPHNLIIVDDINDRRVRTAWKVALRSAIHPVFTCSYGSNGRAFTLGVVGRQNLFRRSNSETVKDWTGLPSCLYGCLSILVVVLIVQNM